MVRLGSICAFEVGFRPGLQWKNQLPQDFAAGIEPNNVSQPVLQLAALNLGVMEVEPAGRLLAALVDVDVDETRCAGSAVGRQVGIGAGRDPPSGANGIAPSPLWNLLDNRFEHHLLEGVCGTPGVVGHPQRVRRSGFNAPVAFSVLHCQSVFLAPGGTEPSSAGDWRMPALRRMLPRHGFVTAASSISSKHSTDVSWRHFALLRIWRHPAVEIRPSFHRGWAMPRSPLSVSPTGAHRRIHVHRDSQHRR